MTEPFTTLKSVAAPLPRDNIDTDTIIPSREMKSLNREGLAAGCFAPWRYTNVDERIKDPSFVWNKLEYRGAAILVSSKNFGCGSSREMAVWALQQCGVRCIIAESFGGIFRNNCVTNGLLPIALSHDQVRHLLDACDGSAFEVDLEACEVRDPGGEAHAFAFDPLEREMLLEGMDPIDLTLKSGDLIAAFQERDRRARPWIWQLGRE